MSEKEAKYLESQRLGQELYTIASNRPHATEEALKLLEQGADPSFVSGTLNALIYAAHHGNAELCRALIAHGANVFPLGTSDPLTYAQRASSPGMQEVALQILQIQRAGRKPEWNLYDYESVACIAITVGSDLKITDIFNFNAHERTRVIENTKTNAIAMALPQNFNDIDEALVAEAFTAYQDKGGKIEQRHAIGMLGHKPSFQRKSLKGGG